MAIAEAFLLVLQADAGLSASHQLLQSSEASAADTQQRALQQRATDQQVLTARVAVLVARQRLVEMQNQHRNAHAALNQLLGRPLGYMAALAEPYFPTLPHTLTDLTNAAVASRPDLLEIQRRALMHEHDARAWEAAKMPQLSAEFGYEFEENRFQSPQGLATAGVVVDWNAFDAGAKRWRSQAANQQASAVRAALRDHRNQVALEVFQAWNDRTQAFSAERVAAESLTLAIEHHRSVNQQYQQGIAVAADLEAATTRLVESRAELVFARTSRLLSQVRLRFRSGLLREELEESGG